MGWAFGVLAMYGGFIVAVLLVRKRWRFHDTPTSDAAHVFPGLSEVHGTVEAPWGTVTSPSDGTSCVWWSYRVEREVKSKNSSSWVTEEHGVSNHPFVVRDTSGWVTVMLTDTEAIGRVDDQRVDHLGLTQLRSVATKLLQSYERDTVNRLFGRDVSIAEPVDSFPGNWRARELRLRVGDQVFITANAQLAPDGASVQLRPKDNDGKSTLFEITVGDEKAAIGNQANLAVIVLAALASLGSSIAVGAAWADRAGGSPAGKLAITTLPLLIGAAVLVSIGIYNRVRRVRERVDFAWSLIEVAHTQRATTVPQLNSVVTAAMDHERTLLERITSQRELARRPSAEGLSGVDAASAASERLVARIEAYPSLRTQANVAQLMQQLTLLNDRVAFGRRFYNDSVERLANRCAVFPDSLYAKALGITPPPYFELTDLPAGPRVDLPPPTM